MPTSSSGADHEDAALLRCAEELQEIGQRDLRRSTRDIVRTCEVRRPRRVNDARHRACAVGRARRPSATTLRMLRADEDAIAFLQACALDLLAVDERAVRRAEILDQNRLFGAGIRAGAGESMSSTKTMSRSLERPTTISLLFASGNSPPWYFPEMKRSALVAALPTPRSVVIHRRE